MQNNSCDTYFVVTKPNFEANLTLVLPTSQAQIVLICQPLMQTLTDLQTSLMSVIYLQRTFILLQ